MATVTLGDLSVSSSNTTAYSSASFTPAANDLLVAFALASDTIVSGGGTMTDSQSLGWTQLTTGQAVPGGLIDTLSVFVSNARAAASAMTVTYDCTGDAASGCSLAVLRIQGPTGAGSAQIRGIGTIVTVGSTAANPSSVLPQAADTNNPVVGIAGDRANPAAIAPPTNWVELGDTGYTVPNRGIEVASINSGETGTTITWGTSVANNCAVAIEVYATSPPAGGAKPHYYYARQRMVA